MPWSELCVISPAESVEAVTAILLEIGCTGVAEQGVEPRRVTGFLAEEDTSGAIASDLTERLARLPEFGLPGITSVEVRPVQEADWANEWRKYFRPLEIGSRLVIKPTWERYEGDPHRAIVEIDPGQAFGTGGHGTTRLCLQALEEYVQPGMVVADIGTGSGILALAAARLGASVVYATDIDLLPRNVSRENVARNGLEEIVQVLEMDAFDAAARNCDLVVANIIAMTIIEITPSVRERLKPGGVYIASGIVDELLPGVLDAISAAGFRLIEIREDEVWRAVVAGRGERPESRV
jgi:ribosomal protein L11 methyltransferase